MLIIYGMFKVVVEIGMVDYIVLFDKIVDIIVMVFRKILR